MSAGGSVLLCAVANETRCSASCRACCVSLCCSRPEHRRSSAKAKRRQTAPSAAGLADVESLLGVAGEFDDFEHYEEFVLVLANKSLQAGDLARCTMVSRAFAATDGIVEEALRELE